MNYEMLVEKDLVPDVLIRAGIRRLLEARLREQAQTANLGEFIAELDRSPIAIETDAANQQHYEVPAAFYRAVLGPRMKYSSGWWPEGVDTLEGSEAAMLDLTMERAGLQDGQQVLELGCGWGSLSLAMAERFPNSRITAVSNSRSQKEFIDAQANRKQLRNLTVVTANMRDYAPQSTFDRIVSVEMFEHMRNYRELLRRIASWCRPDGRLFVHIFTHSLYAYPFEVRDSSDWMAKYFFTGGQMPSHDLLPQFQEDMRLVERWKVCGTHYQKTSEAWLRNMDAHREEIQELFERVYGVGESDKWVVRWRVFFMACAELFGYRQGTEWQVSHYLFTPRAR